MNMRLAINDVIAGAKEYEFWQTFGLNDVKAKYRRSKLGQWWITLSVVIFIAVIGGLYRGIFSDGAGDYMAYLAIGYIVWLFISASITAGCGILVQAKPFLLQKSWPITTFIYRLIYREIIVILHHAVILIPIFLWLRLWPGFSALLLSFLGFMWCVFTAIWVSLLIGIIALRYRDFTPIVSSLLRMAFFATPIIWINKNLGRFGELVYNFNPFRYYLEIVREPLLTGSVEPWTWMVSLSLGLVTMGISLFTLSITKNRLTYWL